MFLGVDIGTTSISLVLINKKGKICKIDTFKNNANIYTDDNARMQDADRIISICLRAIEDYSKLYEVEAIGISNQMHGILYLNESGSAVSPLFTWQDERCNEMLDSKSYAEKLTNLSGYNIATGFGSASLYFDTINNLIPIDAACISTVGDYLAIRLTNKTRPLLHESNAASLGLYDIKEHLWDKTAIERAGLNFKFYPEVTPKVQIVGEYLNKIKVYTAIGDNQASVYGTVKDKDGVVLNYGTGSQITFIVDNYTEAPLGCELRPFFDNTYLIIGGALCGGYSYQLLKNFFSKVSFTPFDYEIMNKWALDLTDEDIPIVNTKFKGERHNPNARASIININEKNFTPAALTYAFLKGMSNELKEFYDQIIKVTGRKKYLIGTGNGVRLNKAFQKIIKKDYDMPLFMPKHLEEAAYGAAILVASIFEGKSFKEYIEYKE